MTKASWRSLKQMLAKIKNQDLENSNPKCSQQETGILEIPTQELSNFELIVCLDTEVVKRDLESKRIVKEILIQGGVNSFVIENTWSI